MHECSSSRSPSELPKPRDALLRALVKFRYRILSALRVQQYSLSFSGLALLRTLVLA
ncbi:hypothetical protein TRAPUB_8 [Trametes pubescens]|uniref:Uncharacterized protein n=1 Tax=Trametes pubescens TaxID=154538 RepID=A0A1M2VNF8_TRAPU|nr:hypothetical protein TRAPUB_8 [Trametes pubescens]